MSRVTLATSIGARDYQQDRLLARHHRDGVIAILADGMGGHDRGDEAAQAAVDAVRECLRRRRLQTPTQAHAAFEIAMDAASAAVAGLEPGTKKKPGTTLLIAVANPRFTAVMGVGDSLALELDLFGPVRIVLPLHEGVGGGLTSTIPDRNETSWWTSTTSLGTLILASDGLSVPSSLPPHTSADELVRRQVRGRYRGQDNVSVICLPMRDEIDEIGALVEIDP